MDEHTSDKPISKLIIKQFLPDNPIILEAGAHCGRDTIKLLKIWPQARVYAFEPVPELFKNLQDKTVDLPSVTCFQMALSNTSGRAHLYVSSGRSDAASSLLKPKKCLIDNPHVQFHQTIMINTTTINDWAMTTGINTLDFLWLDLQGSELLALKASTNILKTVRAIYTEINLDERYEHNAYYHDVKKWLDEHGFCLYQKYMVKENWGNALFIQAALIQH